ncbi:MAG: diguanylate phosphodiesterase [Paenibacillus sp.]|jgi:EAL domain-containing protein (putative c-di-GMP-specific phosphodiesterase class I)|nr:diguanylate phosphodiesterase [Paenibacillus sp.]
MEQHEAVGYRTNNRAAGARRTPYLAVVGLMWDHAEFHDKSSKESSRELWQAWNGFAERHIAELVPMPVAKRNHQWLANDLFISYLFHSGEEQPEQGLHELALDIASRLENDFRRERARKACLVPTGRLRVGLGALACDSEGVGDDVYYRAMKQAIVHAQSEGGAGQSERRRYFQELVESRLIYPVYQPIISLRSGDAFGYESLTRLPVNSWFGGPVDLFRYAEENGAVYRLDRLARELAIDGCLKLRSDQKLFINVMAQIMEDPRFSPGRTISLLEEHHLSPHQVVFEITERNSIEDYPSVKKALQHYRSQGYRIAIDDVGAGYSSLQSIVELRPDYLKVDRSIIQHIHCDDVKEHILTTLQEVAGKIGAELIAEGIETGEELDKLAQMGIPYAQGYWLGRPAPFPE